MSNRTAPPLASGPGGFAQVFLGIITVNLRAPRERPPFQSRRQWDLQARSLIVPPPAPPTRTALPCARPLVLGPCAVPIYVAIYGAAPRRRVGRRSTVLGSLSVRPASSFDPKRTPRQGCILSRRTALSAAQNEAAPHTPQGALDSPAAAASGRRDRVRRCDLAGGRGKPPNRARGATLLEGGIPLSRSSVAPRPHEAGPPDQVPPSRPNRYRPSRRAPGLERQGGASAARRTSYLRSAVPVRRRRPSQTESRRPRGRRAHPSAYTENYRTW